MAVRRSFPVGEKERWVMPPPGIKQENVGGRTSVYGRIHERKNPRNSKKNLKNKEMKEVISKNKYKNKNKR